MKRLLIVLASCTALSAGAMAQGASTGTANSGSMNASPSTNSSSHMNNDAGKSGVNTMAPSSNTQASSSATSANTTFVSQQQSNQWMASNLIGASVVGQDNKSIGEINDIVLDPKGGAEAAVIGVGGFLGVGEKNVAVPFKELQVKSKDDGEVDTIQLSMTKDQLEKAPAFMTMSEKQSDDRRASSASSKGNSMTTGSTSSSSKKMK